MVPFWKCRGWDAAPLALLEQKTLPVHLVPRCGRSNCSGAAGDSAWKSPSRQLPQCWALAGSWCGRAFFIPNPTWHPRSGASASTVAPPEIPTAPVDSPIRTRREASTSFRSSVPCQRKMSGAAPLKRRESGRDRTKVEKSPCRGKEQSMEGRSHE